MNSNNLTTKSRVGRQRGTSPARDQNGMVKLFRRIFKAGLNVLWLKVGIIGQNFRVRNPRRQQIKHVLDPDAHAADARASAALFGIEGNPIRVFHRTNLPAGQAFLKCCFGSKDFEL